MTYRKLPCPSRFVLLTDLGPAEPFIKDALLTTVEPTFLDPNRFSARSLLKTSSSSNLPIQPLFLSLIFQLCCCEISAKDDTGASMGNSNSSVEEEKMLNHRLDFCTDLLRKLKRGLSEAESDGDAKFKKRLKRDKEKYMMTAGKLCDCTEEYEKMEAAYDGLRRHKAAMEAEAARLEEEIRSLEKGKRDDDDKAADEDKPDEDPSSGCIIS